MDVSDNHDPPVGTEMHAAEEGTHGCDNLSDLNLRAPVYDVVQLLMRIGWRDQRISIYLTKITGCLFTRARVRAIMRLVNDQTQPGHPTDVAERLYRSRGRPRKETPDELILKLRQQGLGCKRIQDELEKAGYTLSLSTLKRRIAEADKKLKGST